MTSGETPTVLSKEISNCGESAIKNRATEPEPTQDLNNSGKYETAHDVFPDIRFTGRSSSCQWV